MPDIVALLQCLQPFVAATTLRQFSCVVSALLAMTGRVTMLGISRWAGQGGSYRTVQRFFSTVLPWAQLFWVFFHQHLHRPDHVYIMGGDEVVVSKAGHHTHGLDRFFAGVYGRVIPSLAFFSLSLIDTEQRRSFPVRIEQVVRSEAEKAASQTKAAAKQAPKPVEPGKPGRPKGSKNKTAADLVLSPELLRIQAMLKAQLKLMAGRIKVTYLALDGHFGNHLALHMVRQCDLHLISKLRCDSALYLPYDGLYKGHGPHQKYGDRLDYQHLPAKYLMQTTTAKQIETRTYQMQCLHKEFGQALNVVILCPSDAPADLALGRAASCNASRPPCNSASAARSSSAERKRFSARDSHALSIMPLSRMSCGASGNSCNRVGNSGNWSGALPVLISYRTLPRL